MELPAVDTADAVDHQMVVQMVGVDVGGDQHLEVWELSLGELHTDGVDFLRCQIIVLRERLDEMVELPAVCFLEALLGGDHLQVRGLSDAVVPGDQPPVTQHRFLSLGDVFHHVGHSAGGLRTCR